MKKLILLCLISTLILINYPVSAQVIKGEVSILEKIPQGLYGSWIVHGVPIYSNTNSFSAPSVDYWNIYRNNDVITLENPETNARASVTIDTVNNNTIKFTRKSDTTEEKTIETPTITINGENFWGTDKIVIKKYKDNKQIKTEITLFSIKGIKIGGNSSSEILKK